MDKTAHKQMRAEKHHAHRLVKRALWLSISVIVLILDQLSKWAIMEMIFRPRYGQISTSFIDWYSSTPSMLPYTYIKITSFFNLVMAWNTGVSFSMFSDYGAYMPYILILFALGITLMFTIWLWRTERHLHGICYALVIGGALGNIMDRARFGAVIDFLDFHIMGHHWPAFNVADIAVVSGISILIIVSLFFEIKMKERYRKQRKKRRDYNELLRKRFGR